MSIQNDLLTFHMEQHRALKISMTEMFDQISFEQSKRVSLMPITRTTIALLTESRPFHVQKRDTVVKIHLSEITIEQYCSFSNFFGSTTLVK